MREFLDSKKFKVLLAIFAVVVGFMISAIYNEGSASVLSNIISVVTTPLQRASSAVAGGVSGWFQKYTDYDSIYDENQRLQKEVQSLRSQVADYNTIKQENDQYHKIMNTIEYNEDWVLQPASVIARDAQNRFYSFTIDKGSNTGVKHLDPVMSSDGLVGYIAEVGANHSKVATILDFQVDVGVYNSEKREIGVLSGAVSYAEEGLCVMEYLDRDSTTEAGDLIFTSGSLSGGASMYPRDIYVGKVIRIEPDAHGTSLVAVVEPSTSVSRVQDVFVVTAYEPKEES